MSIRCTSIFCRSEEMWSLRYVTWDEEIVTVLKGDSSM